MPKFPLMLSAALCAFAAPAFAQTAPAATPQAADQPENSNNGDIIVTATRRSEALADVPLAVSAVTAESLQNSGANDIRQLNQLAPSLLVSSTGTEANGSARIRGIGTVGDNPGLESSVAVFIDGVYRSRTGAGLNDLGELDRIEVLRGPQGTLFGRNASAGLLNIITKKPSFTFGAGGEASYGNYNYYRIAGGVTGPITDTIAARLDGVYSKRDGFYTNIVNGDKINDRDRYFVRGQLLFQPSSDVSFRLIGDYTHRTEACCVASYKYTQANTDTTPGVPGDYTALAANPTVLLLQALGAQFPDPGNPYSRNVAVTPGRSYRGKTTDGGLSGELNWNFGAASLTSITAYREYKSEGPGDVDYSNLDLLYRPADGTSYRQFKTFSQELRLQGSLFDNHLDWLVGGYYANEKLKLSDSLKFGADYGRVQACTLVSAISGTFRAPGSPGCLTATGRASLPVLFPGVNATGNDGQSLINAFDALSTISNVGDTSSIYRQKSENYAVFTHNIFKITNTLNFTIGARYTHEQKDFSSQFNNNNTACTNVRAGALPALGTTTSATVRSLLGNGVILGCLFNFNPALNSLALQSTRRENRVTGTAVLSWKPTPDLLTYASYSKGYKAGGFNLDRSALGPPTGTYTNASVSGLQFDDEKVDAYEVGFKYNGRRFNLNVAAFREEFKNFQLNTFNGLFFVVQNVDGCSTLAEGDNSDSDLSDTTGRCTGKITPGVVSQGVELEASVYPSRDIAVTAGFTYADTKYKKNLVGNQSGAPLTSALFLLPGNRVSNAPEYVVTGSFAWTPPLGDSGIHGLLYADTRLSSDYNTGSDLFIEKLQDSFLTVNARIGVRGPSEHWAVEVWAQNLTNENYDQVAFNSPLQGSGSLGAVQNIGAPTATTSTRLYSAFLAEPRTYGVTARFKF